MSSYLCSTVAEKMVNQVKSSITDLNDNSKLPQLTDSRPQNKMSDPRLKESLLYFFPPWRKIKQIKVITKKQKQNKKQLSECFLFLFFCIFYQLGTREK